MIEKTSKRRQSFYTLPGGTQEVAETLHRSLTREVFEETGAVIEIQDLLWTCERKAPSKRKNGGYTHKIEYIFLCSVDDGYKARMGTSPDSSQIGVKWLPIRKLHKCRIANKRLRETLNELIVVAK